MTKGYLPADWFGNAIKGKLRPALQLVRGWNSLPNAAAVSALSDISKYEYALKS
jgi:hypothetical protein